MRAESDEKTFYLWRTDLNNRRANFISNHCHELHSDTLKWHKHSTHCHLQNLQKSNDYFRKIHMKRVSMSKNFTESLVDRRLKNFKKHHLEQRSQIHFRILNNSFQKVENQAFYVNRLSFTDWRTIWKNQSNCRDRSSLFRHEKFRQWLSQRSSHHSSKFE